MGLEVAVRTEGLSFRPDVVVALGIEVPVDIAPTVGLLTDPLSGEEKWGRLRSVRSRLYRSRIEKMAVAVAPSAAAVRRIADLGVRESKLRVAWPGTDTSSFVADSDPSLSADTTARPLRLLYAARITPEKGQHVAIEAVKGLHENIRSQVHLDIVGSVSDSAYLTKLERRAKGAPVSFHLDVPELSSWFQRADIVLFPTVAEEVFGYSAVDGLAAGKPVIFSKVGAAMEVTNGIGVGVPPGDPKRFGEAIRRLVRDPTERAELGRRGRELAVERYSWERAFERYDALIEEAAGR